MSTNIIIATDSFKGSLSSYEAGDAILKGILKATPAYRATVLEVADGGEGTANVITKAMGGSMHTITVTGPVPGSLTEASYGICGLTAVIDIASACGLTLLKPSERNPLYTTSYGVGQIIKDALDTGCRDFIIGLGGSSTNDCGAGMLQSLGASLLDINGNDIMPGAEGLRDLNSVDLSSLDPRLERSSFTIACDVTNPLTGNNGCSMVFAPQKGADLNDCLIMDKWISRFAALCNNTGDFEGAGAAGGLGFAFTVLLNGKIVSGADLILDKTGIKDRIKNADIVITGEGRMDSQTLMGKLPYKIAKLAKKNGAYVIAFTGCLGKDADKLSANGFDEVYSISEGITSEESMARASDLLTEKAYEVFYGKSV